MTVMQTETRNLSSKPKFKEYENSHKSDPLFPKIVSNNKRPQLRRLFFDKSLMLGDV